MVATASAVRIAIMSNIIVRRMVELLSSKKVTRQRFRTPRTPC